MSRMKSTLLAVPVLAFALTSAGEAGWTHSTATARTPDGNLAHATELAQSFVIGTDLSRARACIQYQREGERPRQGRVVATGRFTQPDGSVSELNFAGGVSESALAICKTVPNAPAGTLAEFTYELKGMPRVFGNRGQFTEVSGVLSDGLPRVAPLGLTPAEDDGKGRIHSSRSLFVPDKASQRHPLGVSQTLFANRLYIEPQLCLSYQREAEKNRNKGRVLGKVRLTFPDGETQDVSFAGGVRQGEFVACKGIGRDVPIGTMAEGDFEFRSMPRLRSLDGGPEYALVNTSISTAGDVAFRQPPIADVPSDDPGDDPGPGGGPSPPPPSGGLSTADQVCISKILLSPLTGGSRQIVRPNKNRGGRIEVFGPRSRVADGKAVPSTLGFGSTYAAACADYERKMGPIGASGRNLTAAEVQCFVWYQNMNSGSGPTAVRRDPRGGFHGDYWRPWTGVVIFSASGPYQVIQTFQRRGL